MYKIMVVEDDATISKIICDNLRKWDYEAVSLTDFKDVAKQAEAECPHLILLDVMLPNFNGFYHCSEIRKTSKVPVIFISSASDNLNIVMAMNMGGDDFVAKPFDINVLMAKIGALLRRTYSFKEDIRVIEHNNVILNLSNATIEYNNKTAELTKNDYKILQLLMENKGNVVSRDTIMQKLWESDSFIDDNTLTVNVTRLRKKLEEMGIENYIITKKGIGYMV